MDWERWKVTVLPGERATREAILREFAQLEAKAQANDCVFIYYAGHGERLEKERAEDMAWLIPADGGPYVRGERDSCWIPFDEVARIFDSVDAKHILVALDCCYAGRLIRGTMRSGGSVLWCSQST